MPSFCVSTVLSGHCEITVSTTYLPSLFRDSTDERTQGKWWETAVRKFSERITPAYRLALARCHKSLLLPEPLVAQPATISDLPVPEAPANGDDVKIQWNPSLKHLIMTKRDAVLMAKCGLSQLQPEQFSVFDDLLKLKARGAFAWSAPRVRRGRGGVV